MGVITCPLNQKFSKTQTRVVLAAGFPTNQKFQISDGDIPPKNCRQFCLWDSLLFCFENNNSNNKPNGCAYPCVWNRSCVHQCYLHQSNNPKYIPPDVPDLFWIAVYAIVCCTIHNLFAQPYQVACCSLVYSGNNPDEEFNYTKLERVEPPMRFSSALPQQRQHSLQKQQQPKEEFVSRETSIPYYYYAGPNGSTYFLALWFALLLVLLV